MLVSTSHARLVSQAMKSQRVLRLT